MLYDKTAQYYQETMVLENVKIPENIMEGN